MVRLMRLLKLARMLKMGLAPGACISFASLLCQSLSLVEPRTAYPES